MNAVRAVLGGLLAVGFTAAIVALSQVPYTASPGEDGELRMAWRWRSQRVERCRTRTPEELAKLPAHMRVATSCERPLRPYLLQIEVDDQVARRDSIRARGAESDRPLSVFERLSLAPGRHEVKVTFSPLALPGDSAASLPAPLQARAHIVVAPRQVILVTLDDAQRALVLRTSAAGRIIELRESGGERPVF